jgi:GTP-binding protein HflX
MSRTSTTAASRDEGRERAAIVRLVTRATRGLGADDALDELEGLVRAAGADVVLRLTQERDLPDPATFIGRGKADLLAQAADETKADLIVVDNELTPAQTRTLERIAGRRVIDRTALILDIFARRARTREGQLQVELAQLKYRLPRLAGSSTALSRLGGGIGTRGPGETKLETDRRRIRHRISVLDTDIAGVRRRRGYLRARRRRSDVPVVALVGYTNAGKTTVFKRLTGAEAVASDALFVTLDPLMRRVRLPDARQIVLADTVGFIDRLPHQLVAAFHATLEEVAAADLLLHVVDVSAGDRERHMLAVDDVLREVGAGTVPGVTVFNKCDRLSPFDREALRRIRPDATFVSAEDGSGLTSLVEAVVARLDMDTVRVTFAFDPSREKDRVRLADLYRHARVVEHEDGADATMAVVADVPRRLLPRFSDVTRTA